MANTNALTLTEVGVSEEDAAQVIYDLRRALKKLDADMHNTSTRPCGTCQEVTRALGKPFGCVKLDRG